MFSWAKRENGFETISRTLIKTSNSFGQELPIQLKFILARLCANRCHEFMANKKTLAVEHGRTGESSLKKREKMFQSRPVFNFE